MDFPSNRQGFVAQLVREVFGMPTELQELSGDCDDLPDDFGILAVAKLCWTREVPGIGVDDQSAVLDIAARAEVRSVPLENDIQGLLP